VQVAAVVSGTAERLRHRDQRVGVVGVEVRDRPVRARRHRVGFGGA
jgi:hypothetical protein